MSTAASILICGEVHENADGTANLVSAGMTFWEVPSFPAKFSFRLFIRFPALPLGPQKGVLRIKSPGGEDLVEFTVNVTSTDPHFTAPTLELTPPAAGVVTFEVEIAGKVVATERLTIKQKKSTKAA